MSIRTLTRHSINDNQSQLQKLEKEISKIKELKNSTILYEQISTGDELLTEIQKTGIIKKVEDLVKKANKNEKKILYDAFKTHKNDIINVSQNDDLSIRKKLKNLNKQKIKFKDIMEQLTTDLMHESSLYDNQSSFVYYYSQINRLMNEIKKKKNDIGDLQLKIKNAKSEQEKIELSHQLYEQYELLNNYNVDFEIAYTLSEGYRMPRLYKMDNINKLLSIIDAETQRLTNLGTRGTRNTTTTTTTTMRTVAGKKRTKKRHMSKNKCSMKKMN